MFAVCIEAHWMNDILRLTIYSVLLQLSEFSSSPGLLY